MANPPFCFFTASGNHHLFVKFYINALRPLTWLITWAILRIA